MIIAIDTATPAVSVALADATGVVASFSLMRGRRHVETLIPVIEQLLDHAECSYADITAIAVDRGPGLFTGLLVGVATAKALALALNTQVLVASSLEILAFQWAAHHPDAELLSVVDARRREVYAQRFRIVGGSVSAVDGPQCLSPVAANALLAGTTGAYVVGDVALSSSAFTGRSAVAGTPTAAGLALMASHLDPVPPDDVELLYLRAPDVEINWASRP